VREHGCRAQAEARSRRANGAGLLCWTKGLNVICCRLPDKCAANTCSRCCVNLSVAARLLGNCVLGVARHWEKRFIVASPTFTVPCRALWATEEPRMALGSASWPAHSGIHKPLRQPKCQVIDAVQFYSQLIKLTPCSRQSCQHKRQKKKATAMSVLLHCARVLLLLILPAAACGCRAPSKQARYVEQACICPPVPFLVTPHPSLCTVRCAQRTGKPARSWARSVSHHMRQPKIACTWRALQEDACCPHVSKLLCYTGCLLLMNNWTNTKASTLLHPIHCCLRYN
jgi:hypothetical protein